MQTLGSVVARASRRCSSRFTSSFVSRSSSSRLRNCPRDVIRSIYTSSKAQPYGFNLRSGSALAQQNEAHLQSWRQSTHSPHTSLPETDRQTGFLPVPFVTEQLAGAHHSTDLFSRLLKEKIVCVYGPIEDRMAATITASLLFLEAESPDTPINLYINSPGGSVSAGLSIYDTLQYISCPIHTIVLGQAASMGSLLACAGSPGKRYALPHATIMMHQPSGGYSGTSADIQIHAKEILRIRNQLNGIYSRHVNDKLVVDRRGRELGLEEIERLMDRDYFMSAEEARELGVVDEVLPSRKKPAEEEDKKD